MTSRLTKTIAATLATSALLTFPLSAYGTGNQPRRTETATTFVHVQRGALVSAVPIANLTAAQLDAAASDFPNPPTAKYAVTVYRLVYRTIDHDGRPTTASGIVVLPDGHRGALTVAEYLHGTMTTKTDAASLDQRSTDRLVTALFASVGLLGVAPDYLGLGVGPGRPPYIDTKTETTSSVDMLRAARTFTTMHGTALKPDVLVTGFSEGGRATLGLGRALSRGEARPFRLGEIRAVAGPYDLLNVELPATLDGRVNPQSATLYLAYVVTAWNRTVGLYEHPRQAFQEPYANKTEELFDGSHSFQQIIANLPDSPEKLFTPAFLQRLQQPTGRFQRALTAADQICHDWVPNVPVHLYTGQNDTDVVPANTASCAASLRARGTNVTTHSMGAVDHTGTALAAYPEIIRAFAAAERH